MNLNRVNRVAVSTEESIAGSVFAASSGALASRLHGAALDRNSDAVNPKLASGIWRVKPKELISLADRRRLIVQVRVAA